MTPAVKMDHTVSFLVHLLTPYVGTHIVITAAANNIIEWKATDRGGMPVTTTLTLYPDGAEVVEDYGNGETYTEITTYPRLVLTINNRLDFTATYRPLMATTN